MSLRSFASPAVFAAAIFGASAVWAQTYDPYVIRGVGPGDIVGTAPAQSHLGAPVANARPYYAYASQQSAHAVPVRQGNLGGGFLELLVTGREPSRGAVAYNRPPQTYRAASYASPMGARRAENFYATTAPVARRSYPIVSQPRVQYAAYAPAPRADTGVRRIVDPMFERQEVSYSTRYAPGTLVVDTPKRFLYLVQPNGRAIRYGIGVGRPGFEWSGQKRVTRKAEWPAWRPPSQMLRRRPDLPRFMPGGPANPLGARALYLGSSLYRIHGTNEPWTIGQNVSSGCIRMMNKDVIDLYGRVRVGAKVIVI